MKLSEKVYAHVARIPKGKVSTYKELARAVDRPKAFRAIGRILNKNPVPILVPCHRVVKSSGDLGGYIYGPWKKSRLLASEGVKVAKGKILDFNEVKFELSLYNCLH